MLFITNNEQIIGTHAYNDKHNMFIHTDDSYEQWDYKSKHIIFKGYCFDENGNSVKINKNSFIPEIIDRLPAFSGFFVLVTISKDKVVVYKSLSRSTGLFYTRDDKYLTISDDIKFLSDSTGKKTINPEFCNAFINNSWVSAFLSPVKGIEKINGGCKYVFDATGVHLFKHANLSPTNTDFIEITSNIIKSISKEKRVILHLSGGFDSSFIFYILKINNINFEVYTHSPGIYDNDSEINRVKKLCTENDVPFTVVSGFPDIMKTNKEISIPSDINVIENGSEDNNYAELFKNPDIVFLNGHGGDCLFVQNPSLKSVHHRIKNGKIFKGLHNAYKLCRLKYTSFRDILNPGSPLNMSNWFTDAKYKNLFQHPVLGNIDKSSPEYDHMANMLYFMETLPIQLQGGAMIFSPFMMACVFRSFIKNRYDHNFSAQHDRILARKMAYSLVKDIQLFDIRKRSSNNLLFNFLHSNKEKILTLINIGFTQNLWEVNTEDLRKSLEVNTSIGIDGNATKFLKLMMLNHYAELNMLVKE
ncbi:TPA: lasso peptide isopeptide bond-forming cyclase [Klebsiella aerogenes]|uniref:lasso peptide isopeptide bond-forming cyclase n=1 Tax=Klebsiella aerogenes TaxID=548 RepID=UPI0027607BA2|nr:lasso peptide isopeptide bond-forming cyclase [Klebsiella aerogenes]HDS6533882.1 lasso peptide isopeptide bond-forming cyclase [Klebsiella aerogenes]HDS7500277.1 lasso peptide isopeptide bond-forming cyclase [Klebsiella aerogenes]HDS9641934.1 lasso peptide isopeptide bond-forming cyclase [Klebsiella aerogenes]HDT0787973.1 lasso peptide isopeptide bond-forming cyclase [Klebsiella aerogenes]